MPSTRLTPLGLFAKWLVAPLVCAYIGYAIVGPRIGGSAVGKSIQRQIQGVTAQYEPDRPAPTEPDVDVSVKPNPPTEGKPTRSRRHRSSEG